MRLYTYHRKQIASFVLSLAMVLVLAGSLEKVERLFFGVKPGVKLEERDLTGYLQHEVERLVRHQARVHRQEPIPASIDRRTGAVIPERNGVEVDVVRTVERIMSAGKGEEVHLVLLEVHPRITRKILEGLVRVLGSYVTWVSGSENRAHNIRLATSMINNYLLLPGEVFSFNGTTGPRTIARGFKKAPIIVGESQVDGPGGGVCQVSTTLYNAALEAGMEIVERHPHSKRVHYVPKGRDAAVSGEDLDLRFRNGYDFPVLIKGEMQGRMLKMLLLGPEKEGPEQVTGAG